MRRFIARAIVSTVEVLKIAWLLCCVAFIVLIPCGLMVAAYFDPIPRVMLLMLSLIVIVMYLIAGCCQHVYEWAKKSA